MGGIIFSVSRAITCATGTQAQDSEALLPRVATKLGWATGGVKIWSPFRIFSRRSESQRTVADRFLREALRPAGQRSNAKMLSMLVEMKNQKIDWKLTDSQKARLQKSLVRNGELLAAIKATIRDIECSRKSPGEFKTYLVGLRTSLEGFYGAAGFAKVVELQGSEMKRDQIRKVLLDAWQMCDDAAATPEQRIDQKVKELKQNPAAFLVEPTPRIELNQEMIGGLRAAAKRTGIIAMRSVEELIRYAMRHCGENFPKESFDTYFTNFRTTSSEARDRFMEAILQALQEDRDWGSVGRNTLLGAALGQLATVEEFSIDKARSALMTAKGATWASLDIAMFHRNRPEERSTLESALTPQEKCEVYANLAPLRTSKGDTYIDEFCKRFAHWAARGA